MSTAVTVPASLSVIQGEFLPLTIDCSGVIITGDVVSNPTAVLSSLSTSETVPYALPYSPTVPSVTSVKVFVDCRYLRVGQSYSLVVNFTATSGGVSKALSTILVINVVR